MTHPDIAQRVYNHSWKLDPIIRSLLDTDFYKLLMLQMIWGLYRDTKVTFTLINRDKHIALSEDVDEMELREQLDHARKIRLSKKEMIWLRGNNFYHQKEIFHPDFLLWLKNFRLPEYHLEKRGSQYHLSFSGPWTDVTMWEIPALTIINELRSRKALKHMGRFTLDVLYARAKAKMWSKVERLRQLPEIKIADFGTRRRHSFLWQAWCVEALKEGIGKKFTGTSNILLAMENDLEAVGTNAHELPMVLAALAQTDEELRAAPYRVLTDWRSYYGGNLLIVLPDNFGTESFLKYAPNWVSYWRGFRLDSADPIDGGEQILKWWKEQKQNPEEKLLIFSDSLDIEAIEKTYKYFQGKVQMSFGWGTNLTNDFVGCATDDTKLNSISLVCKVTQANGRPAVKLSDNLAKATGESSEIKRYINFFHHQEN